MAVPKRDLIGLEPPVVMGALIEGTDGPDVLDDRRPMGGGFYDPGTDDTIRAYYDADHITIHNGNDTVYGGYGQDFIVDLGTGNDRMYGEFGADTFHVGSGNDIVDGGPADDSIFYSSSKQLVALDLESGSAIAEGIDTLISIEHVTGSSGNDVLRGNAVNNMLSGEDGDDEIDGRGGDDLLGGENGNDKLAGGAGGDRLFGGNGRDTLDGGTEPDHLTGEAGPDRLTGGAGRDTFFFTKWSDVSEGDTITDFEQGVDLIDVNRIDARPDLAGDQAFTFGATPDGAVEEFLDDIDLSGDVTSGPGPYIHGDPGEIEYRHEDGKTYVFLSSADAVTGWAIVLDGTYNLTASDFFL